MKFAHSTIVALAIAAGVTVAADSVLANRAGGSSTPSPSRSATAALPYPDDGFLEIFVSTSNATSPFYGVHAWNHDGTTLAGSWPRSAPRCGINFSPILADVDGGRNEVIAGVGGCYVGTSDGWIHRFVTGDASGGSAPEWNQVFHDERNTNCVRAATPGDVNGDGRVDFGDIVLLLANWGPCADPCPPHCPADFDEDCAVTFSDLLVVLANWS